MFLTTILVFVDLIYWDRSTKSSKRALLVKPFLDAQGQRETVSLKFDDLSLIAIVVAHNVGDEFL